MNNLERFILELESQIKNGFIPNTGSKLKKLLGIIKVQNEGLENAHDHSDRTKYLDCSACEALEKVEQITGGDE